MVTIILISTGKFTVDAIETIRANVSPVVLSVIDDSDDDEMIMRRRRRRRIW